MAKPQHRVTIVGGNTASSMLRIMHLRVRSSRSSAFCRSLWQFPFLLTFLETNGIKIRPTNAEVARVGLAVAAGEMGYRELLDWILENE